MHSPLWRFEYGEQCKPQPTLATRLCLFSYGAPAAAGPCCLDTPIAVSVRLKRRPRRVHCGTRRPRPRARRVPKSQMQNIAVFLDMRRPRLDTSMPAHARPPNPDPFSSANLLVCKMLLYASLLIMHCVVDLQLCGCSLVPLQQERDRGISEASI